MSSYEFQNGDGQVAARLLDEATVSLTRMTDGWSEVKRAAVAAGIANDNALAQETALVMGYHLRMALGSEEAACRLGPATPADEHSWPPAIENVSADVVRLWSEAADHVTKTCSIARIHDLLFERREGNPWVHAQAAILAYLDFAATAQSELDRTEVMMRAWDLAVRVGAADLHARCRQQMAHRVRNLIDNGQPLPGLLLPLLKALARGPLKPKGGPAPIEPINIDLLLDEALGLYGDGYQVSHVAEIIRSRRPEAVLLDAVNRREVQAYLAQAESGPTLLRQTRLTEAIGIATRRGLHEMADEATAALQRTDPTQLGLKRFSTSAELPRGPVEEWLLGFVRSTDWRDGVHYLLRTDPPTGSLPRLRDIERELRGASVFTRSIGVQLLSQDGLPSFSPTTNEERDAYELAKVARTHAENHGRMLAVGLRRFAKYYGIPSEEELTEVLSFDGSADMRLVSSLARALRHW